MKKKLLSLALALLMGLALLPGAAFAANSNFTIVNGVLTEYKGPGGDVVIPYGVTSIGRRAFYLRGDLTSVTIPDSVTSIGDSAFYGCSSLPSVTIPNSVTSIGSDAFLGCDSLTSVTIPASVTSIGTSAFTTCENLTSIVVEAGNPNYISEDGVLFNKDKTELLCYPAQKSGSTYTIPSSVKSIGNRAFISCDNLTGVTIPSGVTRIGDDAFRNCNSLTNLFIPYGVTSIGEGAFAICSSMTNITIPSSVTSIGKDAFDYSNFSVNIYYAGSVTNWRNINADNSMHNVNVRCDAVTVDTVLAVPSVGGFRDVVDSDYYAKAVLWAVQNGITNGTSEVTFSPERVCTEREILTLLWRANGSPQPSVNRGGDEPDAYYDTAFWWALEKHIVGSDFPYQPKDPCTRSMIVDFLWRAAGSPAAGDSSFTDIPASAHYAPAVSWAVANGITNGTSASTFSPDLSCTRGQAVTFLYRAMVEQ